MTVRLKRVRRVMLLALFTLLPCTSAGDIPHGKWTAGRVVRVAAAPTLHPVPEDAADPEVLQTLAHGYAALVARHSGLTFVEVPFPSTLAAMTAVCEGQADLVLAMGAGAGARLPCPSVAPSRSFPGGASVLAGRIGERLPRRVADLGTLRIAAVAGGPYPEWLAQHYPEVPVLPHPSMRAALAAVDAGIADAAIGLESTAGAIARRHFSHSLRLQTVDADLSTQLHLLARSEDQALLDRIEAALDDITLEEHAQLLQRWARQTLPAALDQKVRQGLDGTVLWMLPALAVLLAFPLLAARRLRRQKGLDQKQAQMTGMISHEVRNSAQAVMASIDLLGQAPLPAGQRELVAAAATASQALRGLLNRTLDFSRLASGTFRPKRVPCDVPAICTQALQAIAPLAQKKALSLQLCAPQVPFPMLATDPDCLRQLLDNLLGNAVKFTDVGGVELRLQLDAPTKNASLLVEVIDSGIGIAAAQMSALFEPFRQADAGRQRGGSGLGLSICRTLAEAMDGTLDVHSVHGRGSRFILRLPVQQVQEDAPATAAASALPRLAGTRIACRACCRCSTRAAWMHAPASYGSWAIAYRPAGTMRASCWPSCRRGAAPGVREPRRRPESGGVAACLTAGQVVEATQRHQVLVDQRQPAVAVPFDDGRIRQCNELLDVDHEEAVEVELATIGQAHGCVALDQQAVVDQCLGERLGLFVLAGELAAELKRLLHHVGGLAIDEQRLAFFAATDDARAVFVDAEQEVIVCAGVDEDEGMAAQVGRDVGLVVPQAIGDEQVVGGHTHGGHRYRTRACKQDREVMQRQREFTQHQRDGVAGGSELELARQDAQIGVQVCLQRHRAGVEQGRAARRSFGGGVAGGGHRGNHVDHARLPSRARQREQPESRIINKAGDNGHPATDLFQLQRVALPQYVNQEAGQFGIACTDRRADLVQQDHVAAMPHIGVVGLASAPCPIACSPLCIAHCVPELGRPTAFARQGQLQGSGIIVITHGQGAGGGKQRGVRNLS